MARNYLKVPFNSRTFHYAVCGMDTPGPVKQEFIVRRSAAFLNYFFIDSLIIFLALALLSSAITQYTLFF